MTARPHVLVCANTEVRETVIVGEGRARLDRLADWEWLPSEGICDDPDLWGGPSADPADAERLRRRLGDVDILLICHGAPFVDGPTMDVAPRLRFVGELIGDRFANRIDVSAVFVNVGRGPIVDSDALIARARRGDIRVCLDVFDPEPVPVDSPIRSLASVFLSPHIAGVTAACRPRCLSYMIDELDRFLAGHDTLFDLLPGTPTR